MKCSICGKQTEYKDNPWRPFCSERCKLIDFGNWADENYRVPDHSSAPPGEEEEIVDEEQVTQNAANGRELE